MNARIFFIAIGFVAAPLFSGTAQSQIQIQIGGGNHRARSSRGNHYVRNQHRSYDHSRRDARKNNNHYRQDQYRNYDHAVKDLVKRGTTNPYSSPQHYYNDRRQQNNHYRADKHRSYDQYARDRNERVYHYQPRRYRH